MEKENLQMRFHAKFTSLIIHRVGPIRRLDCQIQAQNGERSRIQLVQPPDLATRQEQLLYPPN